MKKTQGFTLIELMIVVAIIAILAAIAIPQYQDYVSRSRASAAVAELSGYRTAVSSCITDTQDITQCDANSNGIQDITAAAFPLTRNVTAFASINDGVITTTTGATPSGGGAGLNMINTPTQFPGQIKWTTTGGICNATRGLKPGQGGCP